MRTETRTTYESKVKVICNKVEVEADVDKYQPGKYLSICIQGVRVSLNCQKSGSFVGYFSGMELVCLDPPRATSTYTQRV